MSYLSARFIAAPGRQYLDTRGSVYFVIGVEMGLVKIGSANDPLGRLRDLQCGSPDRLVLAATAPGGPRGEAGYHLEFHADHVRGEWFHLSPRIVDEIHELGGELPAGVMLDDDPVEPPAREQRLQRVTDHATEAETDASYTGLQMLMAEVGSVGVEAAAHIQGTARWNGSLASDLEDLAAVAIAWANALDSNAAEEDLANRRVDYSRPVHGLATPVA